jgi:hypothetical protein
MTAVPLRRASILLFAALVVATGAAFFVTQRLKRSTPIVTRVFFYEWISPNGDGRKDSVHLRFDLPKSQHVTAWIVNSRGEEVRTLADDVFMHRGTRRFVWNGKGDDGLVVRDGIYRLRVGLRTEGRSVTVPRPLHVDTSPPHPRVLAVTPPTILPGAGGTLGRARVRFEGPTTVKPVFRVWQTRLRGPAKLVAEFEGRRGRRTGKWDGLANGRVAPPGSYAISVTVEDIAGNQGSSPAVLPPLRAYAVPHSGVTVSYFTLAGPSVPVRPGAIARFSVGPVGQRTTWRLAPYGRGGAIRRGASSGPRIAVRVPRDANADVYSLYVTSAGGRHAVWPVVVSNGGGSAPVLVVVPEMTWLGQNPVDSNGDGFADTLDSGDRVPLARPFAPARPPASVGDQTVPLLAFLGHIRANYDLTTDVALAAGHAPAVAGHRGVVFAGSERWVPRRLAVALRKFVVAGGRVASFGEDALRRRVSYAKGALVRPAPPTGSNIFGERTTQFTGPQAPLVTLGLDKLQVLAGTDGLFGSFTHFERSDGFGRGVQLLAGAGRGQKPDFVAYRLGRGIVFRAGSDQWPIQLGASPEVADITRRIWTLLSQ